MYCPKCGTKALDDAVFCQSCGARLIVETDRAASPEKEVSVQRAQVQPNNAQADVPKKKKSKKLPMLLGAVVAVVALVVLAVSFWGGKTDYVSTVKVYQPFANSQGLPYTCGDVFERYIESPQWDVRKDDGANHVTVRGTAKDSHENIAVTIRVVLDQNDPGLASFEIESAEFDGTPSSRPTNFLYALFLVYDEGYTDLSDFQEALDLLDFAADTAPNETDSASISPDSGNKLPISTEDIPSWCSGSYYGEDLDSTIKFSASPQEPFEICFYRITVMDECLITGKSENRVGFIVNDGAISGTLESYDDGIILLTIIASDWDLLPEGYTMKFYADVRDENYTGTSDSYDFCGIYAMPELPQNRVFIWPLYDNVYVSFMDGAETAATAEVAEWNIEYMNDLAFFTGYILGNEEEISFYYDPFSETLDVGSESSDRRSVLDLHSLSGTYNRQYLD